jgi:hypothetical protein
LFKPPQLNEDMAAILTTFRSEMIALLDEKNANPLEAVALSANYCETFDKMTKLAASAQSYNEVVAEANNAIDTFKGSAS